jgi:hypothetical protein
VFLQANRQADHVPVNLPDFSDVDLVKSPPLEDFKEQAISAMPALSLDLSDTAENCSALKYQEGDDVLMPELDLVSFSYVPVPHVTPMM